MVGALSNATGFALPGRWVADLPGTDALLPGSAARYDKTKHPFLTATYLAVSAILLHRHTPWRFKAPGISPVQ